MLHVKRTLPNVKDIVRSLTDRTMEDVQLQQSSVHTIQYKNSKGTVKPAIDAILKWTLVAIGVTVLAVPVACYVGVEYVRHGKFDPYGIKCGTTRVRQSHGKYSPEAWAKLRTKPRPDMVRLWQNDDWGFDEPNHDQEAGTCRRDETGDLRSLFTHERDQWEPENGWSSFFTAVHRGPFRFMDLPEKIQVMVLGYLTIREPRQGEQRNCRRWRWTAYASYNRDGFVFIIEPHTTKIDGDAGHQRSDQDYSGHSSLHVSPQMKVWHVQDDRNELRNGARNAGFALWRTSSTLVTGNLLRASRKMNELTKRALLSRFSGTIRFTGRPRTSQLDSPWLWHTLTPSSDIVQRHQWLFQNVRVITTHHYRDAWPDLLRCMPGLERVVIELPSPGWWVTCITDTNTQQRLAQSNFVQPGVPNKHDVEVDLTSHGAIPVLSEYQAIGAAWVKWATEASQAETKGTKRMIQIAVRMSVNLPWKAGTLAQARKMDLELWPHGGRVSHVVYR